MAEFSLELEPYRSPVVNVPLHEYLPLWDEFEIEDGNESKVYSDKSYSAKLIGDCSDVDNVEFFVNGFSIDAAYVNGEIKFEDKRIFLDNFGFVQLSINIIYNDNTKISLYSDFYSVMVKDDAVSDSLKCMADYVYSNHEQFLLDENMKSLDSSSLKNSINKSIETQISILNEILIVYRNQYYYFKNNSKFTLCEEGEINNIEKLRVVNNNTINYIVQNPNELHAVTNNSCINIDGDNYLPHKTLIYDYKKSYDIYENRVVINFLSTIVDSIIELQDKIKSKIIRLDCFDKIENGYKNSAYIIYGITKKKLDDFYIKLSEFKLKYVELYKMYISVIPVSKMQIDCVPKPTHIFLKVKQYYSIFNCIIKWFDYGVYDLKKEDFLVPFLANSQLYECYILLKILNCFTENNYNYIQSAKYSYKPSNAKHYQNTRYNNTFVFEGNNRMVTVYYQPVVYAKPNPQSNNINLLRNTKLSMNDTRESTGSYYLPDYIIKFTDDKKDVYLVVDAKFSTVERIKSSYYPVLAFKYLFSLSTINDDDLIAGLCAVGGKVSDDNCELQSIYTNHIPNNYLPYADILSINESSQNNNDELHKTLFMKLFSKYIDL